MPLSDRPHPDIAITPLDDDATRTSRWRVNDRNEERWLESILKAGIPLGRLVTVEHGPSTGMDEILLLRKVQSGRSEILARRREEQNPTRFEAAVMRSGIRGHQLKRHGRVSLPNLYPFTVWKVAGTGHHACMVGVPSAETGEDAADGTRSVPATLTRPVNGNPLLRQAIDPEGLGMYS